MIDVCTKVTLALRDRTLQPMHRHAQSLTALLDTMQWLVPALAASKCHVSTAL